MPDPESKNAEVPATIKPELVPALSDRARQILYRIELEGHYVGYRPGCILVRIGDQERVFADSGSIEEFGRRIGYP